MIAFVAFVRANILAGATPILAVYPKGPPTTKKIEKSTQPLKGDLATIKRDLTIVKADLATVKSDVVVIGTTWNLMNDNALAGVKVTKQALEGVGYRC